MVRLYVEAIGPSDSKGEQRREAQAVEIGKQGKGKGKLQAVVLSKSGFIQRGKEKGIRSEIRATNTIREA